MAAMAAAATTTREMKLNMLSYKWVIEEISGEWAAGSVERRLLILKTAYVVAFIHLLSQNHDCKATERAADIQTDWIRFV